MAFYVENSGSICRPGRTLVRYEPEDGETEIAIPEGVTRIERKVFQNCENLISVKLPDSVRSVGSWAFEGCKNLREIVLPEQIVYFDDTAVRDYRNLKIRQGDLSFRVTEAFSHFALFRFLEAKDSDKQRIFVTTSDHRRFMKCYFAFFILRKRENQDCRNYLKNNIQDFLQYLIMADDIDLFIEILAFDLATEQDLTELAKFANHLKKYEIQIMLTRYQFENFPENQEISDKFALS